MIINYDLLRIFSKVQDHLLAAGAVETTVAGGAVRDMLLEKPIKDIDIYYVGELDGDKLSMFDVVENTTESGYEGTEFDVTHHHLKYETCAYPIQLMKVDVKLGELEEWITNNFGCNLSKVSFGEHLQLTQQFLDDVEMEIITFDKPVSKKYMDKMSAKYPDFIINGECEDEGEQELMF